MKLRQLGKAMMTSAALALGACGGGGGGGGMSFIPSSPPAPPPPPPPPPPTAEANPLSAPPVGVTTTTSFATIGAFRDVRWNAASKAYEVSFDGVQGAQIKAAGSGPFGETGSLTAADGGTLAYTMLAWAGFSYTRYGHIRSTGSGPSPGSFAFGTPTPAGSVPTTGTASYQAQIDGDAFDNRGALTWGLTGSATFNFDFAAGTLSGKMAPVLLSGWDAPPALPVYNFSNTLYSQGSTTFSGTFDVGGPTASSFQGQFTGPGAQELMAGFSAPYFDTFINDWGVLQGVMAGKR